MLNILTEPLIRMDTAAGPGIPATLPAVYAALMADEVVAFPALRPHQRHAWHAFLAQLGAMAMHRAGVSEPPSDAAQWAGLIRGLTPEWPDDEPWQLVVDDITKPAFMQPPARSSGKRAEYKNTVATPDALDMLVTSKNHDLKSAVVSAASADDWLFALLTVQTMEGFGGSRNYGISRMPSGYGNRPAFSITPSAHPGAHIKRDIMALLEQRPEILDEYPVSDNGLGLLWIEPWDGTKAEPLLIDQLEPFYIEACRRIRLQPLWDGLQAIRAGSLARRIHDAKGLTGDPWAPVGKTANQKGTPPAFLGPRKLGYERIVDGLFSADWEQPRLLRLTRYDSAAMQLVARGMVRGEGRTEGYHERIIPLRPKAAQIFGRAGGRKELEDIARERIADVGKVQRILRRAVATFAAHGDGNRTGDILRSRPQDNPIRKKVDEWVGKLDEVVDARFFDDLQIEFEVDNRAERERIRNCWLYNKKDGVIDHAARILKAAEDSLPCPAIRRYKARANAWSVFCDRLRRNDGLPSVFADHDKEDDKCPNSNQPHPAPNPTETQMPLFQ